MAFLGASFRRWAELPANHVPHIAPLVCLREQSTGEVKFGNRYVREARERKGVARELGGRGLIPPLMVGRGE